MMMKMMMVMMMMMMVMMMIMMMMVMAVVMMMMMMMVMMMIVMMMMMLKFPVIAWLEATNASLMAKAGTVNCIAYTAYPRMKNIMKSIGRKPQNKVLGALPPKEKSGVILPPLAKLLT